MTKKTAIITGGTSGIGLATAQRLATTGDWNLHLLNINFKSAQLALGVLPEANIHQADVSSYESLSKAFQKVFEKEGRIDFVFANAGVGEGQDFYGGHETKGTEPPPPPNLSTIDLDTSGAIATTHLAVHYMRLSPHKGTGASIIITASITGLYPIKLTPILGASKAAVIHFARSIAPGFYQNDGIRVNVICPGTVRTNAVPKEAFEFFPEKYVTPMSTVVSAAEMLVNGGNMEDSSGTKVAAGSEYGLVVEASCDQHFFRGYMPPSDSLTKEVLSAMNFEDKQAAQAVRARKYD